VRIVVLHGWGHTREHWRDVVLMLESAGHRVIVPDLPGFGDEPVPDASWGIAEYAEWVKEQVGSLDGCVILGHSFGGRIAAFIAAQQPTRLRGLILYGAPCLYRPRISVRMRNMMGKWFGKLPIPESIRRSIRSDEENRAMNHGLQRIFRRVVSFDETDLVQRIVLPTLLLWGEHDVEVPLRIAQELHTLISGAVLEVMPAAGHSAHLEQPTLFYGILQQFLARIS